MSIHVFPASDLLAHEESVDCVCGPDVEYIDPVTGATWASGDGPLVIHHSLDGREAREAA